MTKKFLSIAAACLLTFGAFAQNSTGRNCGSTHMQDELIKSDPSLRLRMEQIEQQTKAYELQSAANKSAVTVTIPVVFHVLYNTNNATQNVSDARLIEQINVLNKDFSHTNADANNAPAVFKALAANTNIQFCIAVRDPNGAATTGIIRKFTNVANATFPYPSNDMKSNATGGDDPWPAASYLNIWICGISNGILGFAYLPPAPANIDGVVLLNTTVGGPAAPGTLAPYNLGRTATHEVGHYLNMNHIWGDANCGNDQVADTPTQQTSNFGCPSFPHVTCSNGPNGDMFMNFMDYVDDNCMNLFSAGQSTRMNALFATGGARVGLVTSQGCVPVGGSCGTPASQQVNAISQTDAAFYWAAVVGATSYEFQYRVTGTTTWTTVTTTTNNYGAVGLGLFTPSTTYDYRVRAICSGVAGTYTAIANFTTLAATGCGKPTNLAALNIQQTTAAINWFAVAGATKYRVQYRVNGTTTWTSVNATTSPKVISGLLAGTVYQCRVRATCGTTNSSWTSIINFTTLSASGCNGVDNYEPNNTKATATPIAINFDAYPLISSTTDLDFLSFSTTNAAPKLKVTVDGLPADYDVKLYDASGAQIANSSLAGLASEQIIYNTQSVGSSYKIQVFGYNGAFNATSCYHVRISTSATAFREESIISSDEKSSVSVFPNPSHGNLTITLESDNDQSTTINIVDLTGRNVMQLVKDVTDGTNTIDVDLHGLSDGIYFVKVNTNGDLSSHKIIVKK